MADHIREHHSLLAATEKRLLIAIARRLPAWVSSDQLTLLALVAMMAAGAGFALARWDRAWLLLTVGALAVNWFGDSLDGTLARVRQTERPRYGFYVDHVVDILGATALFSGLAASPVMSPLVALSVLVVYLLVSGETFLATAVNSVFRLSFAGVGPTELRILLATGVLVVLRLDPHPNLGPLGVHSLFDVGGVVASVGLMVAFLTGSVRNTRLLSRLEPLPEAKNQHNRVLKAPRRPSTMNVYAAPEIRNRGDA